MPKQIKPVGKRRNTAEYLKMNNHYNWFLIKEEEQLIIIEDREIEDSEIEELIALGKSRFKNAIFLLELE